MTIGHIYILTDGVNTKIGITTDFDKRMASYATHNPNVYEHRSYPCDIEEAKRIETTIKSAFKDALVGKGKEWFSVPAEAIDRYVSALLEPPLASPVLPSMHGVRLTREADELKNEILKLLEDKNIEQRLKAERKKEALCELFGRSFGLGLPEHRLPPENCITIKDYPSVDISKCNCDSHTIREAIGNNRVSFPNDDHSRYFYHIVRLDSGHFVALCTAKVSMPYLEAIAKPENVREMADAAEGFGWYCTIHNDWSWHYPDKTGLVLYQPKTPVAKRLQAWQGSFRKWVIERSEILKMERFIKPEDLAKCIDDICHDNTFPLYVKDYSEFYTCYIEPYFFSRVSEDDFWLKEPYKFLFNKWKTET